MTRTVLEFISESIWGGHWHGGTITSGLPIELCMCLVLISPGPCSIIFSLTETSMSVPSATAILSYIRLSYPEVKDVLDEAIKLGNLLHPTQMTLLLNLRDLFEYFIPTVSLLGHTDISFPLSFILHHIAMGF